MSGKHCEDCLKDFPTCQCLTCTKDNTGGAPDKLPCCFSHKNLCNESCIDYEQEESK